MKYVVVIISSCLSMPVLANENNGGGGAWRCLDASGKVNYQTLDLWEAENPDLKALTPIISNDSEEAQIDAAFERFLKMGGGALKEDFLRWKPKIIEQFRNSKSVYLSEGTEIAPPKDLGHNFIKPGCELVGVANFDDVFGKLTLDYKKFAPDFMSKTNRAALLFHEIIYKVLRAVFKVSTSRLARHITGCSFSQEGCEEVDPFYGIPKTSSPYGALFECVLMGRAAKTKQGIGKFVLYNNFIDVWTAQITEIRGRVPPIRTFLRNEVPWRLEEREYDQSFSLEGTGDWLLVDDFFRSSDHWAFDTGFGSDSYAIIKSALGPYSTYSCTPVLK